MSDFITRPIGEVFTDENGVRLKVVPGLGCDGCHYNDSAIDCPADEITGLCSHWDRKDKSAVIFVEVKGGQQ